MKLMKLIMVGIVTLTMVFAQNQQGGQPPQGEGQDGPPPLPFEQVDANGDGVISEDEARAVYGMNPDGTANEEFDEGWNDADADGNGEVDQAEYDSAIERNGPDNMEDHQEGHGECRVCGLVMNSEDDWKQHCDENWEHCKPQAGDVCNFAGHDGQGEPCPYEFSGEEGEDHHHCDHCGLGVNSGEEMHEHMQSEHQDMMEHHDGGGDHQGQGAPDNHWDGNQDAICGGMSEYFLDENHDGELEGPYARWDEDQDGNPVDCYKDGPGDPNGPGGPDPAVAEAFFSTLGSGGSFEDAFEAGANVALEQDQQADDYDEELWNNCKEVGRNAMQTALDSGEEDPENVFGAIAMAVGACADPGQN